jgi:hypothetical protein
MKSYIFIIAATLFGTNSYGQKDTTALPAADSTPDKSTLTVGAVYANNASYYGERAQESTPYGAIAATYRFRSGIYLSGLSYRLLNEKNSTISASSLGAGALIKLSKKLSADLSYSHSFYPNYSPLLQAADPDNGSLAFTYESWITATLTGDYAFGRSQDGFATAAVSKSINLFSIGPKAVLTINPSADIVAGTQHFYQTYLAEQKLRDSVLGILLNPVTGNPSGGNNTVATTAFNFLSCNFKFPLSYNRANYVLEAMYQCSVLSREVENDPGKVNSFVTLSFYYQF